MSKMVYTDLIQPLNHSYIPNLKNVWPEYQDPWYDKGAQYTVPYTIYTTGVVYRADRVSSVPENGYDLIWDKQYAGKIYVLDDMCEAIGMSMLRNGITTDINTSDASLVQKATDSLIELIDSVNVKVNINAYSEVPEGTATVHQGWSGDVIAGQYYLPKGETPDVLGYWVPDGVLQAGHRAATTSRSRRARRSRCSPTRSSTTCSTTTSACGTSGGTATSRR